MWGTTEVVLHWKELIWFLLGLQSPFTFVSQWWFMVSLISHLLQVSPESLAEVLALVLSEQSTLAFSAIWLNLAVQMFLQFRVFTCSTTVNWKLWSLGCKDTWVGLVQSWQWSRRFGLESEPIKPYQAWASTAILLSKLMFLVQIVCLFFTVCQWSSFSYCHYLFF